MLVRKGKIFVFNENKNICLTPATCLCLSHARTRIFNAICRVQCFGGNERRLFVGGNVDLHCIHYSYIERSNR